MKALKCKPSAQLQFLSVEACMQHSMNALKCKTLGKLVLVYAAWYSSAKESARLHAYTIRGAREHMRIYIYIYDVLH